MARVARLQLEDTAKKRLKTESLNPEQLTNFLNSPPQRGEGAHGDLRSSWSLVQNSLCIFNAKILIEDSTILALDDYPSTGTGER